MTRMIKASEVKPGMEVEWTHAGITRKCVVSVVEYAGPRNGVKIRTFEGGAVHAPGDVVVTVLSDPAPLQPEVPGRIEEWPEDDTALRPYPWRDRDGDTWTWAEAKAMWKCHNRTGTCLAMRSRLSSWHAPFTRVTDA